MIKIVMLDLKLGKRKLLMQNTCVISENIKEPLSELLHSPVEDSSYGSLRFSKT